MKDILKKNVSISDFSSIIGNLLSSQRSFLSIIRTVAIFAGLTIIVKNYLVLFLVLPLFAISTINFYKSYNQLKQVLFTLVKHKNSKIIKDITDFNLTIYGYCFCLLFMFIVLIYQEFN